MQNNKVYSIISERIIEKLNNGVIPWRKPWVVKGGTRVSPMNLITGKAYRGINILLLGGSGHNSPYWVTFKQAAKLGGKVRKGRSEIITYYKTYDRKRKNAGGEEEMYKSYVLRYYRVWNTDDVEGIKHKRLTEWEAPVEDDGFDHDPIDCAESIVAEMPKAPKITRKGNKAYYRPVADDVHVPPMKQYKQKEEFYCTLFHELAHSTMHKTRLNRKVGDHIFGTKDYSKEELVAETAAAFLCAVCGIEDATLDNSAAYIKGWSKKIKEDVTMIVCAAGAAQKAADYILGKGIAVGE